MSSATMTSSVFKKKSGFALMSASKTWSVGLEGRGDGAQAGGGVLWPV